MHDGTEPGPGRAAIDQLPLTGEPLPLDLVNTTYIRGGLRGHLVDALDAPGALDAWLDDHRAAFSPALAEVLGERRPAGPEHLPAFLTLRRALRALATAHVGGGAPPPEHTATVNAAARLAVQWPELVPGPGWEAVPRWLESDPLRVALGEVAASAVSLFSGGHAGLLRACGAPGCVLFFVKSHARRAWCTAGCGNRVRVARHNRRSRASG
ncbi:ABATE domain-containing protein [Streptomyces sp. NPDC006610]|jgi:predicted RNA-binding Zn ribbon-like protein|uniref:CGNR zinc finger domain-containing protein n=1 Tax=Streptomyces sp. NPDC006610 TaxID=3154584 RepID=UPI0033A8170B